jgi:hypothetical protein
MQAQAAEFSGYAGRSCCFFGKKNSKTLCLDSFIFNHALKQTRKRLFKSFLARNKLAATPSG